MWGCLLGAEDSVSCIAKARQDVVLVVKAIVDGCKVDVHVGVLLLYGFDTLGRGNKAHEFDVLETILLESVDGIAGTTASGKHGVGEDDETFSAGWHLVVIEYGLACLLVAIETDVAEGMSLVRPSTMPIPARRMGTTTTFLPAIMGARMGMRGVVMSS